MTRRIQCFMLEPTGMVRIKLRRYTRATVCPVGPMSCHDASTPFPGSLNGDWPERADAEGILKVYDDIAPPHDDPRWPTHCEQCGSPLPDDTHWQVFQEQVFRRADNGELVMLRDAPPGAMFDASWWPEKGPDGRSLVVTLPPNGGLDTWHVDSAAKGGGRWTRTGDVPRVTARPSILTPRYHGYLTDGWLEEC